MKAKLIKNRNGVTMAVSLPSVARHAAASHPRGTALIVALLVMGVLMAISLALSVLVLRESIVTREFLDAGQSFYAAESASEIGLYGVKNNLPGWEPTSEAVPIKVGENAVAELKVSNKCKAYPCFDEGYDLTTAATDPSVFYATLGLNESATIPLFVVGDDGNPMTVTDFAVEFYANFDPSDIQFTKKDGTGVSDWDVLRWKIVGLNDAIKGKPPVTESISDFTAVTKTDKGDFTNPSKPSWFGTKACSNNNSERYTDSIECLGYTIVSSGNCSQMHAREFYLYSFADGERTNEVKPCWPLSRFINEHKLNYLTLTNLINPSVFKSSKASDKQSSLAYRVELFTDGKATDTVRDFADITADGYSGKSKQSVNVKIKRDSFMPVFNFSLYSTYMDEAIGHDDEFWYGEK